MIVLWGFIKQPWYYLSLDLILPSCPPPPQPSLIGRMWARLDSPCSGLCTDCCCKFRLSTLNFLLGNCLQQASEQSPVHLDFTVSLSLASLGLTFLVVDFFGFICFFLGAQNLRNATDLEKFGKALLGQRWKLHSDSQSYMVPFPKTFWGLFVYLPLQC